MEALLINVKFTKWWMASLVREARKRKFKAIMRFFYDRQYRADIKHIADLTTRAPLTSRFGHLKLHEISFSHAINYPKWVDRLEKELRWETVGAVELQPIKVMYDDSVKRWIVIDGNHRLMAMKRVCPFYAIVPVRILYYRPKEMQ